MRLESFSNLFNDIRLECPGAPNPLILSRARMSAIEVCKRTLISNETLEAHDIDADEPLVYLSAPNSCVLIWRVMWAKLNTTGKYLPPFDRQQLSSGGINWDDGNTDEYPQWWVPERQNDVIRLYPKPSTQKNDELIVHCAFIPHPDTTKMDKVLYDFYRELIVQGAIAKLQRMANTDWYNPEESLRNEREFQVELGKARINQGKDNSIADLAAMMRPFA